MTTGVSRARGVLLVDLVLALAVLALVLVPLFLELHRALVRERAALLRLRAYDELVSQRAQLVGAEDAVRRESGAEVDLLYLELRRGEVRVELCVPVARAH